MDVKERALQPKTDGKEDGNLTGRYMSHCPFRPGQIMWVRETWAKLNNNEYLYTADDPDVNVHKMRQTKSKEGMSERWHSPVAMPRSAARQFLRVKDVRVERVQDIPEKDAEAEGFRTECGPLSSCPTCNVSEFRNAWDARNAKRGYGWDSNPYVWVIEFERTPSGAIGPETDGTAPNGDKGAEL